MREGWGVGGGGGVKTTGAPLQKYLKKDRKGVEKGIDRSNKVCYTYII